MSWADKEGQGLLRQAIMYDCNNKSNKMQVKETVSNMEPELASLQQSYSTPQGTPLFSSQGGNLTLPTCEWL